MPILRVLKGSETPGDYVIELGPRRDQLSLMIGRDENQCEFVLSPLSVSRTHAKITRDKDGYWITDDESRAGTILNHHRLRPNTPHPLRNGDLIQICNIVMTFLDDDNSGRPQVILDDSEDDESSYSSLLKSSPKACEMRTEMFAKDKLRAILELTTDLREIVTINELMTNVLGYLLRLFGRAERVIVVLWTDENSTEPTHTAFRYRDESIDDEPSFSRLFFERLRSGQKAILLENETSICAPLITKEGNCLGAVRVDGLAARNKFKPKDLDVLSMIALQVAVAVENSILHEAALRDRMMQYDLQTARQIQVESLPHGPPECPSYEIADYYLPAISVGGDYYDYVTLADDRLAFILGDVAGKGVPAALQMARVSSELQVYLELGFDAVDVVQRVNRRLVRRSESVSFVTMVLGMIDLSTHEISLVNAGHVRPLLRQPDGKVETIGDKESGLPLGVDPDFHYEATHFAMAVGDTLLIVSDGITEAMNAAKQTYGTGQLERMLSRVSGTANEMKDAIIDGVDNFVGGRAQSDDRCMICLQRVK